MMVNNSGECESILPTELVLLVIVITKFSTLCAKKVCHGNYVWHLAKGKSVFEELFTLFLPPVFTVLMITENLLNLYVHVTTDSFSDSSALMPW